MDWSELSKFGQAIVNKVKLGSAVDGPLVVTIFVALISIIAFTIRPEIFLLYLAAGCLTIYGIAFFYFMLTDPNKLRTEEHEQTVLRMAYGLGESNKKELTEEKLDEMQPIKNPALQQLSEGKKK